MQQVYFRKRSKKSGGSAESRVGENVQLSSDPWGNGVERKRVKPWSRREALRVGYFTLYILEIKITLSSCWVLWEVTYVSFRLIVCDHRYFFGVIDTEYLGIWVFHNRRVLLLLVCERDYIQESEHNESSMCVWCHPTLIEKSWRKVRM